MTRIVIARPLTRESFAPFGDVIDFNAASHYPINGGRCERYHDLARVEAAGDNARVLINLFRGTPYEFPLKLGMVERHPLGSQAFVPLSQRPFVVIVCADTATGPGVPHAFLTAPGQGVNYPKNLWHGVLTPVGAPQDFVVVDRGGEGSNLEEFHFRDPFEIHLPEAL